MQALGLFFDLFFAIFILSNGVWAVENYTEKELTAIKNFRNRMGSALYKEYMKSDPYLIRWLKVTSFDIEKAGERLTKTLSWRKANNIDSVLNETIGELEHPIFYTAGLDQKGGIVTVMGLIDMRDHLQTAVRYFRQMLEATEIRTLVSLGVLGNSSKEGAITKGTVIGDASGFNLRQHGCLACLPIQAQMMRDFADHYPGYARTLIVVNAPSIIAPLVEVLRPIVENQLEDGIKVFGTERENWMKSLHQLVGPKRLGRQLGGTRVVSLQESREYLRNLFKISQQNTN